MPRNRQPQGLDDPLTEEIEGNFVGVNDDYDPSLLGQGLLTVAENVRCYRGFAETRAGSLTPVHFNPAGVTRYWGAGLFSDPNSAEYILAAVTDGVWMLGDGRTALKVALAAGLSISMGCEFTQAFQEVVVWREGAEPLIWNGNPDTALTGVSSRRAIADYLLPLPDAAFGIAAANRIWFPIGKDELGFSDILDYAHYDPSLSRFRINQGESGSITALMEYRKSAMLIFKDRCIYLLDGITDVENAALQKISNIGCVARRTVTEVGGEIIWLADNGVYKLTEVLQNSQQAGAIPISQPISKTMARINWRAASGACAVLVGRYWLLSVPIDNSTVNNAVLVFDIISGLWQGMDTFGYAAGSYAGTAHFLKARLFGRDTAFLVDQGRLVAMGHGTVDRVGNTAYPIATRIETRGLTASDSNAKQLRNVQMNYATWDANWSLETLTDGVLEAQTVVTGRTRDRLQYKIWNVPAWEADNNNDDFSNPHRLDYAWRVVDGCQPQSGIPLQAEQEYQEGWPLRGNARWVALQIRSTKGRMVLKSIRTDFQQRATTGKNKI